MLQVVPNGGRHAVSGVTDGLRIRGLVTGTRVKADEMSPVDSLREAWE